MLPVMVPSDGVEFSLGPYLEQHFAAVMRIFLNDSILVATNPDVSLVVDEATVQHLRALSHDFPMNSPTLPSGSNSITGGAAVAIFCSLGSQVAPVHGEHVVLRIDAHAAHTSQSPIDPATA